MRDWLNEQESQAKYGTPQYAGWKPADADADWRAKGSPKAGVPQTTPMTNVQRVVASTPQAQIPGNPTSIADLIAKGYGGYTGWNDEASALSDFYNTGGQGKYTGTGGTPSGGGSTAIPGGMGVTPSIDLPSLYSSLFQNSGVQDKEAKLNGLQQQYLEARGKISDNPFLSASMIDQRLQRLDAKYKEQTQPLINEIAQKKADIETQLNLQTKQFDINSQQAKDSLNYFNTLLEAGALDNASGEDLANITRSTGVPSSLIQSAIKARKSKEKADLYIDTFTSDSGEVTAVTIDKGTGNVITKTSLGNIGNQQTGGGLSVSQQQDADYQQNRQTLIGDIQRGAILRQLVGHYSGVVDVEEIYRLYNTYSPYDMAEETIEDVKQGKFIA